MSKGSGSVVDIIKKVSAVALPVLVDAAKELISGEAYAAQRALLRQASPKIKLDDESAAETIGNDTDTYVQTNFANSFGYYYSGLTSTPAMQGAVVVAANDDILIWDPGVQGGLKDIDKYLQLEFRGSVPPSISIQLAQNLSGIFEERFKETSLSWSPFIKRYNYPGAQPLIVDVYFVTACVKDSTNTKTAGIARYCFVAYNIG
ncbi:MAG: hypothetical protein NVSMB26_16920 [Beijerinckiaceae bacterium]